MATGLAGETGESSHNIIRLVDKSLWIRCSVPTGRTTARHSCRSGRPASSTRPWNDPHRDIDRKLARDGENLLVLEDGDELVGSIMVGYEGHRGWINYLAVRPDHQRRGLGSLLMTAAEARLRDSRLPEGQPAGSDLE